MTYTFFIRVANCGYTSNDDRIGAMNIYELGKNWVTNDAITFNQVTTQE